MLASVTEQSEGASFDALLPAAVATKAERAGVAKANLPAAQMVPLGVLGGAFIGLGAMFSTVVTSGGDLAFGLGRLLGGLVFSLGLVLVVVAGAELFTGNTLIVMGWASGNLPLVRMLRAWIIVFVANAVGAMATAALVVASEQYQQGGGVIGKRVLDIAAAKSDLGVLQAVALGVLANALVCLAVWLAMAARSVTDKIVAIVGPVTAFVACGFEHSIANLYLLPAALFVKAWSPDGFVAGVEPAAGAYDDVTWRNALVGNLLPVTVGNIIGGAVLVGAIYWLVYLRPRPKA